MADIPTNLLYFGDNLTWLQNRERFPDESVDLVYLDPPFNSNRNYNVLFKESDVRESEAQMHAFEDTWTWSQDVQDVFDDFWVSGPERPKQMLKSLIDALGRNDVTAYLTMMTPRLVELHRVLKSTGSLYLHCDPTASHYLKIVLDTIFGPAAFRNEIVWRRTGAHGPRRGFGPIHDTILFYTKSTNDYFFKVVRQPYMAGHVASRYTAGTDGKLKFTSGGNVLTGAGSTGGESGQEWHGVNPSAKNRHWAIPGFLTEQMPPEFRELGVLAKLDALYANGLVEILPGAAWPTPVRYLRDGDGTPAQDIWAYQPYTEGTVAGSERGIDADVAWLGPTSPERMGYPTQKPVGLLERIIESSCPESSIVLDPFCGCGTAVFAAQKLGRQWIGIDITPLATNLIRDRLESAFAGLKVPIEGWPSDMAGAIALAAQEDKYHFQDWAVIQCGARPAGGERRKGADRGIDGVIPFNDRDQHLRGVVSVKAGNTGPTHVRDLAGVVSRDPDTAFGVFICLHPPTRAMIDEALSQGTWVSSFDQKTYPKMQILSAQDLIDGKQVRMPGAARTPLFSRPARERRTEGVQRVLE